MTPDAIPPPPPLPPSSEPLRDGSSRRKGCLIGVICLALAALLVIGGVVFLYFEAVQTYTATAPTPIEEISPTAQELRAAQRAMQELGEATKRNESREIVFRERDLNALIARDPAFRGLKNKVSVRISSAILTLETSVPLAGVKLPALSGRWLNLMLSFLFNYDDGKFSFDFKTITANQQNIPPSVIRGLNRSFAKSFNNKFRESLSGSQTNRFWRQVESIRVEDGKLIVRTKGPAI